MILARGGTWLFSLALAACSNRPADGLIYVDVHGNDEDLGSPERPLKTLQHAVDIAWPGDTITLRDGTYGPNGCQSYDDAVVHIARAGRADAYLTIRAEHQNEAVLDAELTCGAYLRLAEGTSYLRLEGLRIYRSATTTVQMAADVHHVEFHHDRFVGTGWGEGFPYPPVALDVPSGAHDIVVNASFFQIVGPSLGAAMNGTSLIARGSHLTLTNNWFTDYVGGLALQVGDGASDVLVAHNTVQFSHPTADGHVLLQGAVADVQLINNIFDQPRGAAIYWCGALSGTLRVANNLVSGVELLGGEKCTTTGSDAIQTANNLNADPAFDDRGAMAIYLNPASPAIDAATTSAVAADYEGRPRPQRAAPDIGAIEAP